VSSPPPAVRGAASSVEARAGDPTLDLYRAAHQAHFVDRDYGRALKAWNDYLKAAPHGSLVPEARYNRALCLVRLGRADEARAALTPFATGQYGTYRREDAQKLLAALPPALVGP
jgi:TolA-binding protein